MDPPVVRTEECDLVPFDERAGTALGRQVVVVAHRGQHVMGPPSSEE